MHYVLSAQSDPLIASLCLGAVDCHLSERPRLGVRAARARLAGAARGVAVHRRVRDLGLARGALDALDGGRRGAVVVLALWFGVPALTSRSFFQAGSNALGLGARDPRQQGDGHHQPLLRPPRDLARAAGAAVGRRWRVLHRDRATLILAGAAVAWVIVEIAFALHGWPGVPRYMFPAAAAMVVVAGGRGGAAADPATSAVERAGCGRAGAGGRGGDQPGAARAVRRPGRAQGPGRPARPDQGDRPADRR